MTLFGAASAVGAVSLMGLGPRAAELLAGTDIAVGGLVLLAFALLLVVQSLQSPLGMLLSDATGLRFQAKTVVVMLCLNLPLSIVLAGRLGASGPVLSTVLSVALAQLIPCAIRARKDVAPEKNSVHFSSTGPEVRP
jgi:O-antigen/teichoic acid export membrane protein